MRARILFLLLLSGCADDKRCMAFAEHLADVVASETGEDVDPEVRAKMVKQTTDSCVADPPSNKALDCALAADSSDAMKQCDEQE